MEKNTAYAKFIYEKEDEDLVNVLEEYLNDNANEIFEFFDLDLEKKTLEIRMIPTKEEYDRLSKERKKVNTIPKWAVGNYHDGIIEYVSFNDYQNTSHKYTEYNEALETYKKTIIHEFIHYVVDLYVDKNNGNHPLCYLNEGIAQYLSKQRTGNLTFNYSLDDILNSNDCYPGWYLMVKYILDEYGKDYFLKILLHDDLALSETQYIYEQAKEYYKEIENNKK